MTDRDLFKQALKALEEPHEHIFRHRRLEAIVALKKRLAQPEPTQVSPLEFNHMTLDKEHMVGKPIFWAEWPNKEKNNG